MRKSQSAIDYMMLLGLILGIVIVISVYTVRPREDIVVGKASSLMDTIADYVNHVSELGPGNRLNAKLEIPPGVELIHFGKGELNIVLNVGTAREAKNTTLHRLVKSNVTGFFTSTKLSPGIYDVIFMSLAGGHVCIARPGSIDEDCYCVNPSMLTYPNLTLVDNSDYVTRTLNDSTISAWNDTGLNYYDVITGLRARCVDNNNDDIPAVVVFNIINWRGDVVFPPNQYEGTSFYSDNNNFYNLAGISYDVRNSGNLTVQATCYHECHTVNDDPRLVSSINTSVKVPYGTIRPFVIDINGNKIYLDERPVVNFFPLRHSIRDRPSYYDLGRAQSGDQIVIRTGYECVGGECIMVNASLWHDGS
jgi:hypothetical protein